MITLETGQPVPEHPELEVLSGGDYDESELVPCCLIGETHPYAQFEAKYIYYGPSIYR